MAMSQGAQQRRDRLNVNALGSSRPRRQRRDLGTPLAPAVVGVPPQADEALPTHRLQSDHEPDEPEHGVDLRGVAGGPGPGDLVGVPGDSVEIKAPVLWRNGQPIEGAAAFGRNARREGLYPGYTNTGSLSVGSVISVPEHSYLALGDNSPNSRDSRSWGFVPEKDVVGRPLFIYYPLTKRWGPAH